MKILSLLLENFRGFKLRQIKRFHYQPTQKTQVILGSNGSGKSSMIQELSPNPANPADFERMGRKEIEIQHNGKHYLLQSIFDEDGCRYPFICDGENLNPGNTVTVYKELVKQHFNYSAEIHALLIGKTRFTSMSVNERRNWFTQISDVDYSYAIEYHKRLKESIRNLQGALKRNQDRLVKESEKCLTPKDEEVLRTTVADLNQRLDLLLSYRKPRQTLAEDTSALDVVESTLSRAVTQLERLVTEMEALPFLPENTALEAQHSRLTAEIQAIQAELVRRCEFMEGIQKELSAATVNSTASLSDVQTTLKHLQEEYAETQRRQHFSFHYEEPAYALTVLDSIMDRLSTLLTQLSELPRLNYTRDDYQCLLQSQVALDQELKKAKAYDTELFNQLRILEGLKEKAAVECPNCNHSWHPGYDEGAYRKLLNQRTPLLERITQLEKTFAETQQKIAEHTTFFETCGRYADLVYQAGALGGSCGVWKHVESSGKLLTEPTSLLPFFSMVRSDILYAIQLVKLNTQITENTKLEQLMLNAGRIDTEKLKARLAQENEAVLTLQTKLRGLQDTHRTVKAQLSTYASMQSLRTTIQTTLTTRKEAYSTLIEDHCIAALDEMIRSLKVLVNQHERTLSQVDIQKGIVQSLGQEIKSIDKELTLLKRAQVALSPSEGLIARGMIAFINHFVQQLNEFIGHIWLYPLALQPLALSDEDDVDLDYRFKVLVNNDLATPDVSRTSKGMQEVIDLAFVAVSMRYLGLSNFPMFLDEFAASFDVAHRQAAYKAIDLLIDSTDYSQLFLVSHYQAGYSSLTSSEVLVLCDSNVELPNHLAYNQHVSMH